MKLNVYYHSISCSLFKMNLIQQTIQILQEHGANGIALSRTIDKVIVSNLLCKQSWKKS